MPMTQVCQRVLMILFPLFSLTLLMIVTLPFFIEKSIILFAILSIPSIHYKLCQQGTILLFKIKDVC